MSHRPPPARILGTVAAATLFALTGLACSSASPAAAGATPCPAGTPVTGDYNGDGTPELKVTVGTNWVNDGRFFVSPTRDTHGTWLDLDVLHLSAADLNLDQCADAVAVGSASITLIFGTPAGLDPSTARSVVLPQQAGLGANDRVRFAAVGSTHAGIAQVVVAGRISRHSDGAARDPFVDVFTLNAAGEPGTPTVLDASSLVADQASMRGWPTAIAADDGLVVVGNAEARVAGKAATGSVTVFARSSDPTALTATATLSQATPGVPGTAEAGDRFGQAVALRDGRLAVGVPFESTSKVTQAGQVQLFAQQSGGTAFTSVKAFDQNTPGVPGSNEKKDHFGSALTIARGLTATGSYDVVVGTPMEGIGKARYAGAVTIGSFTKPVYRTFTQASPGVPGTPEGPVSEAPVDGDLFGYAVGTLPTSSTTDTLLIGAPGETNGSCLNQGYVVKTNGKALSAISWSYVAPPTTGCSIYDEDSFYGWGQAFAVGSPFVAELP